MTIGAVDSSRRESDSQSPSPQSGTTLTDLYARGDFYTVLNVALEQLASQPDDSSLLLLACRTYVALGLMGPARELASPVEGVLSASPEGRALAQRIAGAPSGRVGWSTMQTRFDDNIARLYEAHPSLREHDEAFRSIPRTLELYRTSGGQLQIATRARGRARRWLPDLCDSQGSADRLKLEYDPKVMFCGPYLVMADRFGILFDRAYEGTKKMFLTFTPRIYVVEPDVLSFGVTLFVAPSVDKYCDDRVSLFVGPDAAEALLRSLREHPTRVPPERALCGRSLSWPPVERALDEIRALSEQRGREARQAFNALEDHYASLPDNYWKRRFESGQPLRVLGITSRFTTYLQYSMRDCKAAFERHGHRFELLIEENDHDPLSSDASAGTIAELKPDLILFIDHLRREYPQTIPANVPFVCWIQDQLPHLTTKRAGQSMGPLDFYIAPELDQFTRRYDYPAKQGMRWTMATDDRLYSAEPMSESQLAPHRCDISFVSNQSKLPRQFHDEKLRMLPDDPGLRRLTNYLFDAISREMIERPRTAGARPAMALLEQAKREIGLAAATPEVEDAVARLYIHPLTELMYRQRALEWVADYCDRSGRTLHLYGNGWSEHPRFAAYARGFAANGEQLRAVYQASRINLQITSYGAVHQRLLDGLAAGGFFLIRYCPMDMIHDPAKQLLEVVGEHGLQAGTTYRCADVPEFARAFAALRKLHGDRWNEEHICLPTPELERLRGIAAADYRLIAGAVFERYNDVAFHSAETFAKLADHYLADGNAQREIVDSMRASVLERFTYGALVHDMLSFIKERLGEADTAGQA